MIKGQETSRMRREEAKGMRGVATKRPIGSIGFDFRRGVRFYWIRFLWVRLPPLISIPLGSIAAFRFDSIGFDSVGLDTMEFDFLWDRFHWVRLPRLVDSIRFDCRLWSIPLGSIAAFG